MVPRPGRNFPGMQGLNANEVIDSILHGGLFIPVVQREENKSEPQEPRIVELDDNYDTEEEKEKKKARNKKKYLRKKEKAQAEKAELQPQQRERNDSVSESLVDMSLQLSTTTKPTYADAVTTPAEPQSKLSKRQKKTLLKKTKQAQSTLPTSESASTSINGDAAADPRESNSKSADAKAEAIKHRADNKEDTSNDDGRDKQEDGKGKDGEKEVATKVEAEAVMATVAKRFGQ